MDSERFDGLTRRLATGGTTRRHLLRGLGGTMAGAVLAGLGVRPAVAAQDSNTGAHAIHGRRAGQALRDHVAGTCDTCDAMCSNCPIACCAA